ncbi:MAG: lytic transglycosylase domain-containing protein [Rhodoglobus sp.]
MGYQSRVAELRAQRRSEGGDVSGRHVRAPWSLPFFATFVTFAFLVVLLAPPYSGAFAVTAPAVTGELAAQTLRVEGEYANSAGRDAFSVSELAPAVPAAGIPDPGSAQAIAYAMLQSMGLGDDEFACLVALWDRESHWNVYAQNPTSGAYGIPQALPGAKMASAGADWQTSATTQITWGLGYIAGRYGTPCGAWAHSVDVGWY